MKTNNRAYLAILAVGVTASAPLRAEVDTEALPNVEPGFEIGFFVKEPHIINPSALCFDRLGRLYVGAGPQYRQPREDSPADYIKIMIDDDGDGVAETVKTFAEGLNSVQGMAWKGNELWVANAPELTVLRDTDGDDVADEYQIIYTGLNNLRHSLHGLNWGPDGWLYMSLGNTWMKPHAPVPFLELQGIKPEGTLDYPLTKVYTRENYKKSYHPLNKDEKEGGIFRCQPGGHDLELYARGMRNPWDICMDSGFNWLGTDNDPGQPGERIFMPVPFAHYSMRHPWMFDWMGKHPAIAPSSDLFPSVSGSGTGVAYYHSTHFPGKYRNQYLIADWTNNCIFLYEPRWEGSLQVPASAKRKIVDGGVTQGGDLGYKGAKGRALFRPTDIEVGPDGALYMAGWGSVYGTEYVPKEKWTAEENAKYQGRVFRLSHKEAPLIPRKSWDTEKRRKDLESWSFDELIEDIGHQVHVWRVHAQDELIRRGTKVREQLLARLAQRELTEMQATWTIWALGQIDRENDHRDIIAIATGKRKADVNLRVQATRILGENKPTTAMPALIKLLDDREPRVRLAAIQSLGFTGWKGNDQAILSALADETDRLTLYTGWQVMRRQMPVEARKSLLADPRAGVRLMAALGLMEERKAEAVEIFALQEDPDERVRKLAGDWLGKTGVRKVEVGIRTAERNFRGEAKVEITAGDKRFDLRYTLDGTDPTSSSRIYQGTLTLREDATIKAAAFARRSRASDIETLTVHRITDSEWQDRLFVRSLATRGDRSRYEVFDEGLQRGVLAYGGNSRDTITSVPETLAGATLLRTHAGDSGRGESDFLSFEINLPARIHVGHDARFAPPAWLRDGFEKTGHIVTTSRGKDGGEFQVYTRDAAAGKVTLGGNAGEDEKHGNMYQVYLTMTGVRKTTLAAVTKALPKADLKHGEEIFFGRGTCFACHQVKGKGVVLGPDLKGINKRQDMNYVIRSILNPDEYIVEGFQQTSLEMKDGRKLFGMLLEETGQAVKIFLPTGERVVVNPNDIRKRDDAKNSGMPSSFVYTLSPRDVADVSAWIMSLK